MTEIHLPPAAGGYKSRTVHEFSSTQEMIEHYDQIHSKFCVPQKPVEKLKEPEIVEVLSPPIQEPEPIVLPLIPPPKINNKYPSINSVIHTVCAYYGVTKTDLISDRRFPDIVHSRHIAIYIARVLTLRSTPEIGRRMGDRDHSTVIHACRKIARLMRSDVWLCAEVAEIIRHLDPSDGLSMVTEKRHEATISEKNSA